eukprot:1152523-Pelagomonas_calceolata.AAC.1
MTTGVPMRGPDGVERLVAPVVLNFIGDNPEELASRWGACSATTLAPLQLSSVAGTFCSHNCNCKCQRCYRHTKDMGTLTDLEATTMRKERSQKAFVVNTIAARQQGDNHTSSKLSTRSSTHPVFSSFWGLGIVDIHEKITHKKLHNNSLGVTRTVLRVIELYLGKVFSKKRATEITKELNLRLGSMDRYYDLQLPLSLKKGYFFEACHVQGHEHANVSKLLPHLLIGLTSVARGVDLPMDLAIAWRLHQMTLAGDKRPLDYVGSQQQATDLRASNAHLLQCFLAFE